VFGKVTFKSICITIALLLKKSNLMHYVTFSGKLCVTLFLCYLGWARYLFIYFLFYFCQM